MPRPAVAYLARPRHVRDGWLQQWVTTLRSFAMSNGFQVTRFYVDEPGTCSAGYQGVASDLDSQVTNVVITPSVAHLERGGDGHQALRARGAVVVEVETEQVLP